MRRAAMLALALAACRPWASMYFRDSPRRLDVVKQPGTPALRFRAVRTADGVELTGKRERDVRATRTLRYGAWRADYGWKFNPLYELAEVAIGIPVVILFPASMLPTPSLGQDTPARKIVIHNSQMLAFVNPLQGGGLTLDIQVSPSDADLFADSPQVRDFTVRLPAAELAVHYVAVDDGERAIATGDATTDAFGRAQLAIPAGAIALEVTTGTTTAVVAIEEP